MTISTSPLATEVAVLRAFDGRVESELSGKELDHFREAVGRSRRMLDAVAATLAGEVARRSTPELGAGGLARKEGFRTPQEFLAKTLGTSPGDAGRLISVGGAFAPKPVKQDRGAPAPAGPLEPTYPHVAAAVADALLGVEYAALIKRTLDAIREALEAGTASARPPVASSGGELHEDIDRELDELERRLVKKAPVWRLSELRRVCERERAWRSPQGVAAKEQRHVDNRTLYFGADADGMVTMTARMDAASAAPIVAWVDAQTKWAFRQRRAIKDGGAGVADGRMAGQVRLDALASLAAHGLDCDAPTSGVKTTVVIRINEKDLRNDLALGDCDQLSTNVTVATLRAMAVDAAILPLSLGGTSLPLDIGHDDRIFTSGQRIALAERDGGCSWCHAPPSFCEAHHIKWWARDHGKTDLSNGVLLCTGCHHRIHRDGWAIEVKGGDIWFTPPPSVSTQDGPRIGGKKHLTLGPVP